MLGNSDTRVRDKRTRELDEEIKTRVISPPTILKPFSKLYTSYAFDLVMLQWKAPTTSFNVMITSAGFTITTANGVHTVAADVRSCSCDFYRGYGLPCRHILFIADRHEIDLPLQLFRPRWLVDSV